MKTNERLLTDAARRADYEQAVSGHEGQVYSQVIGLIEALDDDSMFQIDFATNQAAMQDLLNGLGVGKITEPKNQVVYMSDAAVICSNIYGSNTIEEISPLLEELPVTDSLKMIQAGEWGANNKGIKTPGVNETRLYYLSHPDSEFMIVVSCFVRYGIELPEWDYHFLMGALKGAEKRKKMAIVGGLMASEDLDDHPILPQQTFSLAIAKNVQHRQSIPLGVYPGAPVTSRSIGTFNFSNGSLTPQQD